MKERLHTQVMDELGRGTRTDTIITIITIILDLIFIGAGFGLGSSAHQYNYVTDTYTINTTMTSIMFIFIAVVVIINYVAVTTLLKGKKRRLKLTEGLVEMYTEEGMDKYYDPSATNAYEARYNLFAIVTALLGLLAAVIPLIIFTTFQESSYWY
jgi:hypothetical protein